MFDSVRYDSPMPKSGEGRTFTSEETTEYFELKIWLPGQGPMRDMIRAASLKQAMLFARNRYPGCLVEVPEKTARMRPLARSADGAKKRQQRQSRLLR